VVEYRLAQPARRDIAKILSKSRADHGDEAERRYRALLLVAFKRIAADPKGISTIGREQVVPGLRSFHIRHSRNESPEAPVARAVHLIVYRIDEVGRVVILRVLHERMDPIRHMRGLR